jgi:hypothetical protein
MKPPTKKALGNYYAACESILVKFTMQYYCDKETKLTDVYIDWVGDQIGGVASINDEFWSMDDMVTALELDYPNKKLFEWYWYSVDERMENRSPINMRNYLKLET